MLGTQQTVELLTGLETLLVSAKKILADKKVNLADLPQAMSLINQMGDVVAGINGADQIPAEIKDLTADEAKEVLAKLYAVITAVKAA